MEKSMILLASVVLTIMSNFASAAGTCESQASRLKASERAQFLMSCLDRMGSPENVRQSVQREKLENCERNAKNLSLRDESRSRYVSTCIERNEAAIARAESGKREWRISRTQIADTFSSKPAPKASAPQKNPSKESKDKNAKQRTRQGSATKCKDC